MLSSWNFGIGREIGWSDKRESTGVKDCRDWETIPVQSVGLRRTEDRSSFAETEGRYMTGRASGEAYGGRGEWGEKRS